MREYYVELKIKIRIEWIIVFREIFDKILMVWSMLLLMKEMVFVFEEMVYEFLVIVRGVNNKFGKDFKINFCCYWDIEELIFILNEYLIGLF